MKLVLLFSIHLLLVACGGGGGSGGGSSAPPDASPEVAATGLLVGVSSAEQLLASVKAGFSRELAGTPMPVADVQVPDTGGELSSPADGADGSSFTTTYTQEANVDEHDIVKYDGRHLYIAPTRGMGCCFLVEPELSAVEEGALISPLPEPGNRAIRVLATDPVTARASQVSEIDLKDGRTVEGLYVEDDRLAVITSTSWWGYYGNDFARPESWADQSAGFQVFDVSSADAPAGLWAIEIEGGFVTSRRVGDTVYLVTRHTPSIDGLYFYPVDEEQEAQNTPLLDALTLEDITPRVLVNGQEDLLFDPEDCVTLDPEHELAPQQRGYPVLTTIIAIDIRNPGIADTLCYSESTGGVYVSENAIYLTQSDYNGSAPQTIVHRFDYREGLQYRGSGKVKGDLYTGGNRDFRISEFDDYLRLVTTIWTRSQVDRVEHFLHVLSPAADDLELDLIATLPNDTQPQPIGKPNEDLYGVRFLGDRAYLVTFERIDPLYVIDLSQPRDPRIVGELEVTGFSDFLHPVSDALLLGLGQDQEGLVKLELFDISDLSKPTSLGALSLSEGARWTRSEARYDRHAFTYLAGADGVDRFTVPLNASFHDDGAGYSSEDRLHLLEIRDKSTPGGASLVEVGYISAAPLPESHYGSNRNRAVIHADAVFFINGEYVWSALWDMPFNATGPQ